MLKPYSGLFIYVLQVPNFPVFTRSGEVTVSIDLVSSSTPFTAAELDRLNKFERFMFAKVLRLEKDPMSFDPDNADSSYTVIPLNEGKLLLLGLYWEVIG